MKHILSLIFTAFIVHAAVAQEAAPQKLSLQDCMDYAVQNNYTVKNAQLDILIQQAQNAQTAALAYPKVNGKAEFDYFTRPQSQFLNARTFGGPSAPDAIVAFAFSVPFAGSTSISASQLIFDGSALVALQARKMALELAQQNARATVDNIKYNIFKAYFALAVGYRQRDLLAKSLGTVRTMLYDLDALNKSGFAEKIDVERSNVQINNLQNDSASLENGIKLYEYALKYTIGMDIKKPISITDTALDSHTMSSARLLLETDSYERVPEYTVLTTVKSLLEYNVKRYKLAALPSLAAFANLGTNYGSDKFADIWKFRHYESNSLIGLQLNVPIFNGFVRQNQVKEAKLNVQKAQNNIDNLKSGIDFMAAQARATLKNSLLQLKSQTENLNLATEVVDLAQKKYKAGVGSNLEVTTAQAELLKTQNTYFSTLLNIINAEGDLRKALGMFNR
ncbi:MAG: TolC family protein [Taibaiella sp.]|nr:TolC family protein [Taibaiella sp.]